jgi:hypothetical protein
MKLGLSKGGKKAYLGIFALLGYYTAYDGSCLLTFGQTSCPEIGK